MKANNLTIKILEIDESETLLAINAPNDLSIAIVEPDEMAQCCYDNTFNGYFGCIYKGYFYVSDKYPHKTATANYYRDL